MGRDLGLDGVVDHFTLSGDEAGWLRNKTGATRLGFAVQLKFLTWRGRFPRMRLELPPDAVEHVAKQVGVAASELAFYDFSSRAAKRHRSELRDLTGWHECTKTDLVKLVSQLVDVIWHDERREEQVRAELLRQMREDLIEPPTAAQNDTVIRSALHQADARAVAEVTARLARAKNCTRRLDALVFADLTADGPAQGEANAEDEDDVESVTEAFVAEFTKIRGKPGLLGKIAAASLSAPEGSVREVVYPAAGEEKTLKDLVAEMKATNAAFARSKREAFKSSYRSVRLPGPARPAAPQAGSAYHLVLFGPARLLLMGGWSHGSEFAPPLQFVRVAADCRRMGDRCGSLRCRLTTAGEQRQRPGRSARLLTVEGVPVPGRNRQEQSAVGCADGGGGQGGAAQRADRV
ncbi:DUF4158 domain-containing protein [Streptomyces sp. NPDC086549]|uniref:DUF4158 domain-containing protein n=1 Tax=Streptomyces sp. NPDC086549 TaxID=3365752 RepID=UPI003808E767